MLPYHGGRGSCVVCIEYTRLLWWRTNGTSRFRANVHVYYLPWYGHSTCVRTMVVAAVYGSKNSKTHVVLSVPSSNQKIVT
jgi:hypothetical protein